MKSNKVGRIIPEVYAEQYGIFEGQFARKPKYKRSSA